MKNNFQKFFILFLLGGVAVACLQEKGGNILPETTTTAPKEDTTIQVPPTTTTNGGGTVQTPPPATTTDICNLANLTTAAPAVTTTGAICFDTQVLPIIVSNCASSGCHDAKSKKDGYDLTSYATITQKGIVAGDASKSKIYKSMIDTGEDRMPPAGPIASEKINIIKEWINQGAKNITCQGTNSGTGTLPDSLQISYVKHLKPVIDTYCVGCHKANDASGNVLLDSYASVKLVATNGRLYGSIAHLSGFSPMPTTSKLSDCQIKAFKNWIDQGMKNN